MKAPRERLPNRRRCETFNFECRGLWYTATASRYADGRLGEIFIGNHRADSQADANARDSAIVFSIALQHGVDPEVIARALLRDSAGRPSTPLGVALNILRRDDAA